LTRIGCNILDKRLLHALRQSCDELNEATQFQLWLHSGGFIPVFKDTTPLFWASLIWRNHQEIIQQEMLLWPCKRPREFFYNGSRIPDPDPKMEVDQIRELLTPSYPEIATATMIGPEETGTALRYTFSRAIGSKG
jgi:PRTRC genetic system protein C